MKVNIEKDREYVGVEFSFYFDQYVASIWDLFYRTIALSNLVIENIQDSNLSNKDPFNLISGVFLCL